MGAGPADAHGLSLLGVTWPKGDPESILGQAKNLAHDSQTIGQIAGQVKGAAAASPSWVGAGADQRAAEANARAGVYQLAADPLNEAASVVGSYANTLRHVQDELRKMAKKAVDLDNEAKAARKRQASASQAAKQSAAAAQSAARLGDTGTTALNQQSADMHSRDARNAQAAADTAEHDLQRLRKPAKELENREKKANKRAAGVVNAADVPKYSPRLGVAAVARGTGVAPISLGPPAQQPKESGGGLLNGLGDFAEGVGGGLWDFGKGIVDTGRSYVTTTLKYSGPVGLVSPISNPIGMTVFAGEQASNTFNAVVHIDETWEAMKGEGSGAKQTGHVVGMLIPTLIGTKGAGLAGRAGAVGKAGAGEARGAATAASREKPTATTRTPIVAGSAADPARTRPKLRVGVKQAIRDAARKNADGDYIDPNTGVVIPKDGPYDFGHKPGVEWRKTQRIAREEHWTRQQVIEYENNPSHFQIEDPPSNRGHKYEDHGD